MDIQDRNEKQERYCDRFSGYLWNWSGTLFLPPGRSRHQSGCLFKHWLDDLKRKEGTRHFRWVRVMERDMPDADDHFDILVGGLRNRCQVWEERWGKASGAKAFIHHFDKSDEMETYNEMMRTMDEDGKLDLKYEL